MADSTTPSNTPQQAPPVETTDPVVDLKVAEEGPAPQPSSIRLTDIWGQYPRVTAIPTWIPKRHYDEIAYDETADVLYIYDFAAGAWQAVTGAGLNAYVDNGNQSSSVSLNLASSSKHMMTLTGGPVTISLTSPAVGQVFMVRLIQDATGSRTVTWFTTIKWPGGVAPTLTTTAAKIDVFGFVCVSAGNYDGFIIGQNL